MTPKLVRDRIPEMIEAQGRQVQVRRLDDQEFFTALRAKLQEECGEYLVAPDDASALEELADVLEVVLALAACHGADPALLESTRAAKMSARGGFGERVWLVDAQ